MRRPKKLVCKLSDCMQVLEKKRQSVDCLLQFSLDFFWPKLIDVIHPDSVCALEQGTYHFFFFFAQLTGCVSCNAVEMIIRDERRGCITSSQEEEGKTATVKKQQKQKKKKKKQNDSRFLLFVCLAHILRFERILQHLQCSSCIA